jgi:hypothetical protein
MTLTGTAYVRTRLLPQCLALGELVELMHLRPRTRRVRRWLGAR